MLHVGAVGAGLIGETSRSVKVAANVFQDRPTFCYVYITGAQLTDNGVVLQW
jgi:hypothetical protein